MEQSGKINRSGFENIILKHCGSHRQEVQTGPEFGVDTSIIELQGEQAMVLTSDPLTLIPSLGQEKSAWLSVHLLANDLSTSGLAPQYLQLVLNLPPDLSDSAFETYWTFIHKYCKDIDVAITGGHTCKIEGQQSTIVGGGTMIAVGPKHNILSSKKAKAGDALLLTKQCAISSTSILALSFPETVIKHLGKESFESLSSLFYQTSTLNEALIISNLGYNNRGIHAMHDVTEGGVTGGALEMAMASGNGLLLYKELFPVHDFQKEICHLFSLDYSRIIGAGAMLVSAEKKLVGEITGALQKKGIECTVIGEFTENKNSYNIFEKGIEYPALYHDKDPYWLVYFDALKKGWK